MYCLSVNKLQVTVFDLETYFKKDIIRTRTTARKDYLYNRNMARWVHKYSNELIISNYI